MFFIYFFLPISQTRLAEIRRLRMLALSSETPPTCYVPYVSVLAPGWIGRSIGKLPGTARYETAIPRNVCCHCECNGYNACVGQLG